jgi:hypothetical protein
MRYHSKFQALCVESHERDLHPKRLRERLQHSSILDGEAI